jgi:hypothetical protein
MQIMPIVRSFVAGAAPMVAVSSNLLASGVASASRANDTLVLKVPVSALTFLGTEWQFELKGAGLGSNIERMDFGQTAGSGDVFDFAASPAPVQVPGSWALSSSSGLILTPIVSFTSEAPGTLMFAFNIGTGGILAVKDNSGSGFVSYVRDAVQQSNTVNKTGYTSWGTQRVAIVNRIFTR